MIFIYKFNSSWCTRTDHLVKELSSKYPKIEVYSFDIVKDDQIVEELEKKFNSNFRTVPMIILTDNKLNIIEQVFGDNTKGIIALFEKGNKLIDI